jgi:hypothetical protein
MRRQSHVPDIQTLKTIYFGNFYTLINYRIIFLGYISSMYEAKQKKKKILRTMLGISSRSSCRKWFKQPEIFTAYDARRILRQIKNDPTLSGMSLAAKIKKSFTQES